MQFHGFLCYYQPMLSLSKRTVTCKIFVIFLRKYFVWSISFSCVQKKNIFIFSSSVSNHFIFTCAESCNLFHGEWVPHSSGPAYTNASCRFIESPQNCMTNGRPDTAYLYWRWKPYGCDIPSFDGKKFLDGMRGKHWALIGDSILRNHVQSLLCLVSEVFCDFSSIRVISQS
jgi:hypothetical protein